MGKNKIVLQVEEIPDFTFMVEGEPKSENDLLKYPEYNKYYNEVGLGAPVEATVTVKDSIFKSHQYKFNFKIKGNFMTFSQVKTILDKYKNVSKCEHYHIVADKHIHMFLYSFESNDEAYKMYQELADHSNVGVNHGRHRELGKFVVLIEYHQI